VPNRLITATRRVRNTLRDMVGSVQRNRLRADLRNQTTPTRDVGTTDYLFWRRAFLGKAKGLELSGLLLKPLASKLASWVLGRAPRLAFENAYTQELVNQWWSGSHDQIVRAYMNAHKEGDRYLILNGDFTITVMQPEVARPLVDASDFGRIIGWEFTEVYPHPTEPAQTQTITDRYTATERVRTVRTNTARPVTTIYPNPLGRVPVVHIAANCDDNELFGRSIGEPLLPALYNYNEVLSSATSGNIRQGRSTPVMKKMGNLQAVKKFMEEFGHSRSRTNADGTVEQWTEIEFDADRLVTLAGEADFKWESPQPFITETERLLGLYFYLYIEHAEIPEFVMGNAIASSKASAETQLPVFERVIEMHRAQAAGWVTELIGLVVALYAAVDRRVRETDRPSIEWETLTKDNGELILNALRLAREEQAIDRETLLEKLPINIKNPRDAIAAADEEAAQLRDPYDTALDDLLIEPDADDTATEEDEEIQAA